MQIDTTEENSCNFIYSIQYQITKITEILAIRSY